jgi:flagellar biosynthesis component FlhA
MSKRQFLIILGIWNIVFLFLGFPAGLDRFFALIMGALLIIIAYRIKPEMKLNQPEPKNFVENKIEMENAQTEKKQMNDIISNSTGTTGQ